MSAKTVSIFVLLLIVAGCSSPEGFSASERFLDDDPPPVEDWVPNPNPETVTTPDVPITGDPVSEDHILTDGPLLPAADWFGTGTAADLLRSHLSVIAGTGPTAEAAYEASLADLVANAAAVRTELLSSYTSAASSDYTKRWTLVQIAGDMRDSNLLGFLQSVASNPVYPPPFVGPAVEASGECRRFLSEHEQELQVRDVAIQGLGLLLAIEPLAARGALESLVEDWAHPSLVHMSSLLELRRASVNVDMLNIIPELEFLRTATLTNGPILLPPEQP